jgi:hypothetical protein
MGSGAAEFVLILIGAILSLLLWGAQVNLYPGMPDWVVILPLALFGGICLCCLLGD